MKKKLMLLVSGISLLSIVGTLAGLLIAYKQTAENTLDFSDEDHDILDPKQRVFNQISRGDKVYSSCNVDDKNCKTTLDQPVNRIGVSSRKPMSKNYWKYRKLLG